MKDLVKNLKPLLNGFKKWNLIASIAISILFSMSDASAQDNSKDQVEFNDVRMLQALNPNYNFSQRDPSSFTPDDEIDTTPERQRVWLESVLVEDSGGVLSSVRSNLNTWQATEDYAKIWNLDSTGLYEIKTTQDKKAYLNRNLLKYIDKRLAGEIRQAEEGSTLHTVGKAQKALRPNAEVGLTKNFKMKFKARVLQGRADIRLINPYVDYITTVNVKGDVKMNIKKEIKEIKLQTSVDYDVTGGVWVAMLDRPLSPTMRARVTSSQSDKSMAFSSNSNSTFQLLYNKAF